MHRHLALPLGRAPNSHGVARRRLLRGSALLACLIALYLFWWAGGLSPVGGEILDDVLLLGLSLAGAIGAHRASRRAAGFPRLRGAWRLVALAMMGQALGEAVQLVYEGAGVSTHPTLADPLYLSFYPLLLFGVLRFPAVRRTQREALELLLDSAIATLGGGAVFLYLGLGPDVIAARSPLDALVAVAYPVGDLILLVALATVSLRGATEDTGRILRPIAVAIGLFALADLLYGSLHLHGGYRGASPMDILYMLAFVCLLVASFRQRVGAHAARLAPASPAALGGARWFPYMGIAAAGAVTVAKELNEAFFPEVSIAIVVALIGVLVVLRQTLSQARERRSRERLAQAQEIAQVGSWEWDAERDLVERSEVDLELYGLDALTPAMTIAQELEAIDPRDRERLKDVVRAAVREGAPFTCEIRINRPDGEPRTLLTRGEVQMRGGRVARIRGTHQDITARKRMETQLQFQADHDPLTGLYNRRRFGEELGGALRHASRYRRPCALLMLDLDDLKVLNDTHGHAAGDRALRALAQAILDRVREQDVVARIGGDEFAVLLPEAGTEQASAVAEDIRAGVAAGGLDPPIHVTGGLAAFDGAAELAASDALVAADIALYEAKEAGKDRVQVYNGGEDAAITWVKRIRAALAEQRLVLYEQPIFDLRRGGMTQSELLVRMISEDGELIEPAEFLPAAERFGLAGEIDRWVAREGLRLAAEGDRVSINLSAQSIGDESILEALAEAIDSGVDAHDVIFEIAESAAMHDMQETRAFAEALVELGCEVALDDFGTGFGSFACLKRLPARYLKIDMEFVHGMLAGETDRQVVAAITNVAHSLGMLTIAEGVEDAATLKALREHGVDRAQGFYLCGPRRVSSPTPRERSAARRVAKIAV